MIVVPFTVNDAELRKRFLEEIFPAALGESWSPATPPLWGGMTAQQMVEHLFWSFRCSTGALVLPCATPETLLERVKRFLHDDRPTSRGIHEPVVEGRVAAAGVSGTGRGRCGVACRGGNIREAPP